MISGEADSQLVGLRFKPGGAWPFLGVSLEAVTDTVVELEDLLRPLARALRDPLLEVDAPVERLAIVEAALLARRGGRRRDPRVARALASLQDEGRRVADVAADLGITHKHLISLFQREVGLSPKSLARVLRFNGVVRALESATKVRWTDVAHAHGYADQSHLVGEFRAFTGVTPSAYLRTRSVDPNHLVLD